MVILQRTLTELKGFCKICLEPGESKLVTFEQAPEYLRILYRNLERTVVPGEFLVMMGRSSEDTPLQGTIIIE